MSKSFADLEADLADLAEEAVLLREVIGLYRQDAAAGEVVRELLSKSGLAATTTRLYGGCARIMEQIAKEVDGAPVGQGDGGWHARLLRRMAQPHAGVRGPVLSEGVFAALDRLRGFRHRERSSYGRQLDGAIVAERAGEMADAAEAFRREVGTFLMTSSGTAGDGKRSG